MKKSCHFDHFFVDRPCRALYTLYMISETQNSQTGAEKMTAKITINRKYAGCYKVSVEGKEIGVIVDAQNGSGLWHFDGKPGLALNTDIHAKGYRRTRRDVMDEIKEILWKGETIWSTVNR